MVWKMIAEAVASRGQQDIERCIATFLAICDDYSDNNGNLVGKCAVRVATRISWIAIDLGIQRGCCAAVQNLKINLHICKNLP